MARIIKSNTLAPKMTPQKISVSDSYSKYLRVKKQECSENTLKIYSDMGTRIYVPGLIHYTGNDMSNITADVLRSILDDYAVDHDANGVQFVYRHLRSFINWYWNEYDILDPNPMKKVSFKKVDGADPHEIVNVYGLEGFNYMIRAAEKTELSVRYMIPSCVPATPLEDSGAIINAFDMQWPMGDRHVPGLGEFMNYPGIINKGDDELNKILVAKNMHKVIDGHAPYVSGAELNAYAAAGVHTDHDPGDHTLQL